MASIRAPLIARVQLAKADDLDGSDVASLAIDVSGDEALVIVQSNDGTAGTAGIDVVEFTRDGVNWNAATAAKIGGAHLGLLKGSDLTAVTNAALNAAGVEPVNSAVFLLGPLGGPAKVRIGRKTTSTNGTTWVTGAPVVYGYRIGGAGAISVTEPN